MPFFGSLWTEAKQKRADVILEEEILTVCTETWRVNIANFAQFSQYFSKKMKSA